MGCATCTFYFKVKPKDASSLCKECKNWFHSKEAPSNCQCDFCSEKQQELKDEEQRIKDLDQKRVAARQAKIEAKAKQNSKKQEKVQS